MYRLGAGCSPNVTSRRSPETPSERGGPRSSPLTRATGTGARAPPPGAIGLLSHETRRGHETRTAESTRSRPRRHDAPSRRGVRRDPGRTEPSHRGCSPSVRRACERPPPARKAERLPSRRNARCSARGSGLSATGSASVRHAARRPHLRGWRPQSRGCTGPRSSRRGVGRRPIRSPAHGACGIARTRGPPDAARCGRDESRNTRRATCHAPGPRHRSGARPAPDRGSRPGHRPRGSPAHWHGVLARPRTGSRPRYRRGPLCGSALASGLLAPSRRRLRRWLGAPEGTEALVRCTPQERFEAEAHRLGVGGGTTHLTSLREQLVVDVKRLLHLYWAAILVHPRQPSGRGPPTRGPPHRAPSIIGRGALLVTTAAPITASRLKLANASNGVNLAMRTRATRVRGPA